MVEKPTPARFADMPAVRMAGVGAVLVDDAPTAIPSLWQRFAADAEQISRKGDAASESARHRAA